MESISRFPIMNRDICGCAWILALLIASSFVRPADPEIIHVAAEVEAEDATKLEEPTAPTTTATTTSASTSSSAAPEKEAEEGGKSDSEHTTALTVLDSLLRRYDRRATPTNHLGEPTVVDCKLYVRSLGSINPDTMDYQVDLYLRQHWSDPRLNHPNLVEPLDLNDPNLVKAIWKPEVYFPNAKDAEFQYVTVPNVLVRINPGGKILYMLRLKLKFSCMMELSKFPLDEQVCTMEIASFSKTTKELVLQWKDLQSGVDISSEVKMPQFEISRVKPSKCQENFHIGNYSCLLAELHLRRSLGFHMVQSYLPTILIVVISWVSFWMDVDSVAGRTTLGVTTLLTVSSKASDVQAEVPLVSYVKAIDIWMGACTAFIFAALLEFTLTNYLWRKGRRGNSMARARALMTVDGDRAAVSPGKSGDEDGGAASSVVAAAAAIAAAASESPPSFSENGGRGDVELREMKREVALAVEQEREDEERERERIFDAELNGNLAETELISNADGSRTKVQLAPRGHAKKGSSSNGSSNRRKVTFSLFSHRLRHRRGGNNKSKVRRSPSTAGPTAASLVPSSLASGEVSDCILAVRIDEWSRTLFPLCFVAFNVAYWSYYTKWSRVEW